MNLFRLILLSAVFTISLYASNEDPLEGFISNPVKYFSAREEYACMKVIGDMKILSEPLMDTDLPMEILNFEVKIDSKQWRISDYLVGMHSVYTLEPDSAFVDGKFDEWLKSAGIPTMRYPGGTIVKFWDWKNPTGVMRGDPWSPDWDLADNATPENWRSLDEYLVTVEYSGMVPMIGVNITSAHRFNMEQESVDRAVRMVQYVKNRGHGGAFWYLGNEGMNGSATNEARLFTLHAKAMKEVDPTIKCIFNENNLTPGYLKNYMRIAGEYVDIAETHGKWPYGGKPSGYAPATIEEWQVERPLRDRKNHNRKWRTEADVLKKEAIEMGYPELKFANNEYGLGSGNNLLGFDRYTESLIVIDMLQEHFIGNWYMACFWTSILGVEGSSVLSIDNNYRFNPMHIGFEMLAEAQGGQMLEMKDENNPSIYGFAAQKENEYFVYLLNKSCFERKVKLNLTSTSKEMPVFKNGVLMVDTEDGFGEKTTIEAVYNNKDDAYYSILPALSYAQFKFAATN